METKRTSPFAWLQGTQGTLRTAAATNDLISRFSALETTAKMFGAEVSAALVDKDPLKWDFFMKRWFFAEELNKEKTRVYEDVIGELIQLLDTSLKTRGERFTRQDLELQQPAYVNLKRMEQEVDGLFGQESKGQLFSILQKYVPFSSSMLPPRKSLSTVDITRKYDDIDADEVLKFPYDRKINILARCKRETQPSWQKTCVDEGMKKEISREGHRPEDASYQEVDRVIQGLIQSADMADTQLKKNSYVDSAIDIAFRKKGRNPSFFNRATSFVTGRGGERNKTRRRNRNRNRNRLGK